MCLMIWSRFKDDGMKGLGFRARICVLMAPCDMCSFTQRTAKRSRPPGELYVMIQTIQ